MHGLRISSARAHIIKTARPVSHILVKLFWDHCGISHFLFCTFCIDVFFISYGSAKNSSQLCLSEVFVRSKPFRLS